MGVAVNEGQDIKVGVAVNEGQDIKHLGFKLLV